MRTSPSFGPKRQSRRDGTNSTVSWNTRDLARRTRRWLSRLAVLAPRFKRYAYQFETPPAGEFGNAIRGPLGIHRGANRRFWFYGADYALEDQIAYLKRLRKVCRKRSGTEELARPQVAFAWSSVFARTCRRHSVHPCSEQLGSCESSQNHFARRTASEKPFR